MSDQRLQGKVALVSGGATGIGAAVVRRFAREGAAVAVVAEVADGEDALARRRGVGVVAEDEVTLPGGAGLDLALQVGDRVLIDGLVVNGSARSVGWIASVIRFVHAGYLYHYAIAMILGLLGLVGWFVVR